MPALLLCLLWILSHAADGELLSSPLRFEKHQEGRRQTLFLVNTVNAPVTVKLTAELTNCQTSQALPRLYVVPANGRVQGPTFGPRDPHDAWHYRTGYVYQFGDHRLRGAPEPFSLPWKNEQAYRCLQSFHGEFSHQGTQSYALDFDLPLGTPVLASREGIVVDVQDGFTKAGTSEALLHEANLITLAHSDGTLSRYLHLAPNSQRVRLGQQVEKGQVLALSGNTGFSRGPHLHLEVCVPGPDLVTITIPFKVLVEGGPTVPVKDRFYAPL